MQVGSEGALCWESLGDAGHCKSAQEQLRDRALSKASGSRVYPCANSDTQLMILSDKKDNIRLAGSIS